MTEADSLPWSPASAPIWALVCHFAGEHRRRRKLLMLRAYFDDSWNDKVFIMGGFLADATSWAQFSDDWAEELNSYPRISSLVMNHAMKMKGAFRHLTEDQRNSKIARLGAILSKHMPVEIYSVLPMEPFHRIYEGSEIQRLADRLKMPRYIKMMRDPYYRVLSDVISGLAIYQLNSGIKERIDFIFDEKVTHEQKIRDAWYSIVESQHPDMQKIISSSPLFISDEKAIPLQAADMAAWWRRKNWQEAISNEAERNTNSWGTNVLPLVYTEEKLRLVTIKMAELYEEAVKAEELP